jgi:sorbose reductase
MTIPPTSHHSASISARDELGKRSIPHMILGTGDGPSLTVSPAQDIGTSVSDCAAARFKVDGNAIVTGGTGTLGLAACNALLEHGLSGLAIFDVNAAHSEAQLVALKKRFPSRLITCFHVDVTDEVAVQKAVDTATETLGSINHLLCFSGVVDCVNAMDMSATQWRRVMDVNTTGSFFCAQAVARKMAKQGTGGSIVFTASISAHRVNYPQPQAAYNVSKAALITLKNCLAAEWARYGIRINSISPGYMDTILNEGDGIAEARNVWAARNPTGRMGTPAELTSAVIMLSASSSTYVNGCDIVVDGGAIVF